MTSAQHQSLHTVHLDGLPGPTHHFGGQSPGNLASQAHAKQHSSPRRAARQGLAKMRRMIELGVHQALLPPLPRPDLALLRACGLGEGEAAVRAAGAHPELLHLATSSAFMWTANCATVAPWCDSRDGRGHVVVANLVAMSHRANEGIPRTTQLRQLLHGVPDLEIHPPLPALGALADEGAANHLRVGTPGGKALHLFIYGQEPGLAASALPQRHPARQRRAASEAVARLLCLPAQQTLFARQHPAAIDAGAFHNDVVMMSEGDTLILHQGALADQSEFLAQLRSRMPGLCISEIPDAQLSLQQAVASYLFNSQLIPTPKGNLLLAPSQARAGAARATIDRLLGEGVICASEFLDLGESMANGGGPACLRLRLQLSPLQMASLQPGVLLDLPGIAVLERWVDRHYRDRLEIGDLADPDLAREGHIALEELATLYPGPPAVTGG